MKLKDKVAVITGAGSGIGRAMAIEFAIEGVKVVVVDWHITGADETVKSIIEMGGEAISVKTDISQSRDVDIMVSRAIDRFGKIDILCNNAGIWDNGLPVCDISEELWDKVVDVNLKGPYLVSKRIIPEMLKNGSGSIINTASINGLIPKGGGSAYVASKHGIVGLTKMMAVDYGRQGIKVNAICPGPVESAMTAEQTGELPILMNRRAKAKEIARLAIYLACSDSDFMHGSAIVIDAGYSLL